MPSKPRTVLAFDAYGTLLSTESIAKQLASHFGDEKAATIAQKWRLYQLEYTWRLNSMGHYEPFSSVTRKSLHHALNEASLSLDDTSAEDLMNAYNNLSLFPDVPPIFDHLKASPHIEPVIFSNGTADMINTTLSQSPEISPHASLFKDVVVVEECLQFKPAPLVYHYLCEKVGKGNMIEDVWLISGNPFDVVGANSVGMRTCWVDRSGSGWVDCLGEGDGYGKPTIIVKGLNEVVEKVDQYVQEHEHDH